MEIDGRPYLHIEDYRAWAGPNLRGDLQRVEGIMVAFWNHWVDRQGGEGRAELAGVKVGYLNPLLTVWTSWSARTPMSY